MSCKASAVKTRFNLESLTCSAYNQTTRQHGETRRMYSFIGVLESGLADIAYFIAAPANWENILPRLVDVIVLFPHRRQAVCESGSCLRTHFKHTSHFLCTIIRAI